jgi:DNA-binding NarL/FixJ family response regulator
MVQSRPAARGRSVACMGSQVRMLIADRNALVVEAIQDLFVELDGGASVLKAASLPETLEIARREQPELIVIDAWMGIDAGDAVRQLLACSPRSALFVMVTECDEEFERRMRRAGATGAWEKEAMPAGARHILATVMARR